MSRAFIVLKCSFCRPLIPSSKIIFKGHTPHTHTEGRVMPSTQYPVHTYCVSGINKANELNGLFGDFILLSSSSSMYVLGSEMKMANFPIYFSVVSNQVYASFGVRSVDGKSLPFLCSHMCEPLTWTHRKIEGGFLHFKIDPSGCVAFMIILLTANWCRRLWKFVVWSKWTSRVNARHINWWNN